MYVWYFNTRITLKEFSFNMLLLNKNKNSSKKLDKNSSKKNWTKIHQKNVRVEKILKKIMSSEKVPEKIEEGKTIWLIFLKKCISPQTY